MPQWVKNHPLWEQAKKAILENYKEDDDNFFALVTAAYRRMGGTIQTQACEGMYQLSDEVVRASETEEVVLAAAPMGNKNAVGAHSKKYSWGRLAQVEFGKSGISGRAVLHPEHQEALHKLKVGESHHFTDEQSIPWHATKLDEEGNYHFQAGGHHSGLHGAVNLKGHIEPMTKAIDQEPIYCRDYAGTPIDASAKWDPDQETKFMHMPAGVHTITAGFRDRAVRLTVEVDPPSTAQTLQASFTRLQSSAPKQKPFGCVEHDERDASIWPNRFEAGPDGVYLAGEPSALGAEHVNGKIHRSWSPSFTTDADYAHAVCASCHEEGGECACKGSVLEFPDGVRGSVGNPARVTGTAFVVGTLTNKPAFRAISPVKAKEEGTVRASGTSEGAKKGWEERLHHHYQQAYLHLGKVHVAESFDEAHDAAITAGTHATQASGYALRLRTVEGHDKAVQAHRNASYAHDQALGRLSQKKEHNMSEFHATQSKHHDDWAKKHVHWSDLAGFGPKASESITDKTVTDILRSKPQPHRPIKSSNILARLRPPPVSTTGQPAA